MSDLPPTVTPEEIEALEAARGPLPPTVDPEAMGTPTPAPEVPQRDPGVCVNCGQPATQRTTNPGANVDYYCDFHAQQAYPVNTGQLEPVTGVPPGPGATPDSGQPAGSGLIILRAGTVTADQRLDRIPQFDQKSRGFAMAPMLAELAPAKAYKPRSYTWKTDKHFDQGPDGACVGYAWAHELVARPVVIDIDQSMAAWIYKTAQKYDAWAGEAYDGTSVLAGAKVITKRPPAMPEGRGLLGEYRWIFGDMNELIKTLSYFGPVVLGTNWYTGMFDPDGDGFIHRTGDLAGGHAILIKGVSLAQKAVRLHNSWGTSWGQDGDAWLSWADLEQLLGEQGELCVPVHRKEWG